MLAMLSIDRNNGFAADSLNHPAAQTLIPILFDSISISGDDLEFQAGTSGIEDENIHAVMRGKRSTN